MKERVYSGRSRKSGCCHYRAFLRSRHSLMEKQPWNLAQAGDTDLLVPLTTSLWCDADSAADSGRATQ